MFSMPVSSSRLRNVMPPAVAGRWRWVTAPPTRMRVPSGTSATAQVLHVPVRPVGVALVGDGSGGVGAEVADAAQVQADGYPACAAGVGFQRGVGEAAVDVRAQDGHAVAAGVGDEGLR